MKDQKAILVADDDIEDHHILMDYFMASGLEDSVCFLENGQKLLEYLERISDDLLPQLIVLDLNMPILNGTQTLQTLKKSARLRNIPVIIYSTSDNEQERRKSLNFGAIDYLVKPNTFAEGQVMVDKFINFIPGQQ